MKLLPFLMAAGLFGQEPAFVELATGNDGAVVYFSTHQRQSGTNQPAHGKIFRATEKGVELADSRERIETGSGFSFSNYYDLQSPFVNDAGELMGVNARRDCSLNVTTFCWRQWHSTTLRGKLYQDGVGHLSGNGRWLVQVRARPSTYQSEVTLHDLVTGSARAQTRFDRYLGITANGEVVAASLMGQGLFIDHQTLLPNTPRLLAIHRSIPGVLYSQDGKRFDWLPIQPAASARRIAESAVACTSVSFLPGSRFSAACGGQVWLGSLAGDFYQVTNDPAGVLTHVVSGNARVVWWVNGRQQLVKLDLPTGRAVRVTDASWLGPVNVVPGGVTRLAAGLTGLPALTAQPPYPVSLGGVRVRVAGMAAPILSVSDQEIVFQTPWEIPSGPQSFALDLPPPPHVPAFVGAGPETVLVTAETRLLTALHEDWRGPLTPNDPAAPGEIVHLYGESFGAVEGTVRSGEIAPAAPLNPLRNTPLCFLENEWVRTGASLPVLYAGLAPGLLGIYQISVRMPLAGSSGLLNCKGATLLLHFGP